MDAAVEAFEDVEVLKEFIVFQFEDQIDHGNRNTFKETSEGGIILKSSFDAGTKEPRWAKVIAVGPEVSDDINVGSRILIAPMMWTKVSIYKGERFARTQEEHVLAVEE